MRCAFVTFSGRREHDTFWSDHLDISDYTDEDDAIAAILQRDHGVTVDHPVWDDPTVDWNAYDAAILRSPWDYTWKADAFAQWVRSFQTIDTHLLNTPTTVLWNMHKFYLRDMAAAGIAICPTVFVNQGSTQSLRDIMREQGWAEAVYKPAISAGGRHTERITTDTIDTREREFRKLTRDRDMLVQCFMPHVTTEGEWSFIFLRGTFSHAVLKTPPQDAFRVHDGTVNPVEPNSACLKTARTILSHTPEPTLYARVDGIITDNAFILMELEVIEPFFYNHCCPHADERSAAAFAAHIQALR